MAIVTVFDLKTMTAQKYHDVISGLEQAGVGNPKGRIFHVGALTEAGTMVITDVWESAEKLAAFGEKLVPVLHKNGVTPVDPAVTPVSGIIFGSRG
jgi:hypothetical protein